LTRTITRVVGVIPTPAWIVIGLLAALALVLGVGSRLSTLRAAQLERQRRQLLEDVGLLQAALLPIPPTRLGPVGTSAAYQPAEGPAAGGDFYDMFALEDGQLAVILGDISGHGRQALPHTALVRFTLRAYLEAGFSPRTALQNAETVLDRQLEDSFATVVVATYQPRERILTYACAGHPPPIVLGSQAITPITICSSPPIGTGMPTGTRQTVVSVPGSSLVCFHTDGVTEARVQGGELFGAERLTHTLAELGPQVTASMLLDRVAQETDARPDDMAACLLNIEGDSIAPAVLVEQLELDRKRAASNRTEQFLLAYGVERSEIQEIIRSARLAAERDGTVLLELLFSEGAPEVTLRRNNVAHLQTRQPKPRARVGGSR
jgi:Stage II sporulation protein E (SpoIIE)